MNDNYELEKLSDRDIVENVASATSKIDLYFEELRRRASKSRRSYKRAKKIKRSL